ncbi:hypothetical protein QYE76_021244 [Lolium multiflorum]|uniref:Uncharacterized protein n=1 Tax=Lolium multiflorum TaxID=4521 RepID=A0AAD8R7D0_LOLMU|nr:hypothetical protein QYE76_021244 [Lolium multiflorum]
MALPSPPRPPLTTCDHISEDALQRYPASPAMSSDGDVWGTWEEEDPLRAPTTVEQLVLLDSFQSARERILRGHEEPIDATIVEIPFRSVALEERGREFMVEERRMWYEIHQRGVVDSPPSPRTDEVLRGWFSQASSPPPSSRRVRAPPMRPAPRNPIFHSVDTRCTSLVTFHGLVSRRSLVFK